MIEMQLVDQVIACLKEKLPGRVSRIDAFPDRPDQYDFPAGESAAVFVRYDSSDFSSDDSLRGTFAPRETLKIQVVYLVRSLRKHDNGTISAPEIKHAIRQALQGRSFAGATPMQPVRHWLDGCDDGEWRWAFEFRCSLPAVANYEDEQEEEW